MITATPHPAKFSDNVLDAIEAALIRAHLTNDAVILDPFAGVGKVHRLPWVTRGVELEPEWAAQHPDTIVGDATDLPFPDATFDAVVTSPCYGNRMADHHEARDLSVRNTYRHRLRRELTHNNAGAMQWGPEYRDLHAIVWAEVHRVLRPGGVMALNISNHYRDGLIPLVVEWHLNALGVVGMELVSGQRVRTPRNGQGANRELRVDHEVVALLRKPHTST